MLFGVFDSCVLLLIFIFNYGIWKYKIIKKCNWKIYLVAFLFFGGVIPILSVDFEIQKATSKTENVDSFNLLYTYFRFPIWWFIGILELVFIYLQTKKSGLP